MEQRLLYQRQLGIKNAQLSDGWQIPSVLKIHGIGSTLGTCTHELTNDLSVGISRRIRQKGLWVFAIEIRKVWDVCVRRGDPRFVR